MNSWIDSSNSPLLHLVVAYSSLWSSEDPEISWSLSRFWQMPGDHQVQERNSIKVRTVLRQFVRDWADEGAPERDLQYGCLLDALERYVPNAFKESGGQAKKSRVLTPGSGLSRLPFECARRGYAAQGNEFSYHMLQGCKWVPWPLLSY